MPPSSDVTATGLACLTGVAQSNAKVPVAAGRVRIARRACPTWSRYWRAIRAQGAVRRFDQLTSHVFHGCPSTTKTSTSAGIGQTQIVVLPQVGDESAAVAVPTAGNTTSTVVVARTKGTVVYLVYETHGPADTDLLQLLAIRATAKAVQTP